MTLDNVTDTSASVLLFQSAAIMSEKETDLLQATAVAYNIYTKYTTSQVEFFKGAFEANLGELVSSAHI